MRQILRSGLILAACLAHDDPNSPAPITHKSNILDQARDKNWRTLQLFWFRMQSNEHWCLKTCFVNVSSQNSPIVIKLTVKVTEYVRIGITRAGTFCLKQLFEIGLKLKRGHHNSYRFSRDCNWRGLVVNSSPKYVKCNRRTEKNISVFRQPIKSWYSKKLNPLFSFVELDRIFFG